MAGADTALVLADHRRMASCRAAAPATSQRTFQLGRELLDVGARSPLGIYSAGVPIVDVSARRFALVEDLNGMIRRASSACISGLTSRGSGVIHTDTSDLEGSSPEAVARSTSHLVKIPARNDACTTTAEPALALTMAAAALAMLVSGVTVTALAERRSRTVTHGSAAAPRGLSAMFSDLAEGWGPCGGPDPASSFESIPPHRPGRCAGDRHCCQNT